jgi:hypothetical protein
MSKIPSYCTVSSNDSQTALKSTSFIEFKRSCPSSRVRINISGRIFNATVDLLERFPNTLLGNKFDRSPYYDETHDEYFFERHSLCFESILYFYQSMGRLYRPKDIPIDIFIDEMKFFRLDPQIIMDLIYRENLHFLPVTSDSLPENWCLRTIWLFFEQPRTILAKTMSTLSVFLIIVSVVCACLETSESPSLGMNGKEAENASSIKITHAFASEKNLNKIYLTIEFMCNGWFLIELVLRFASCPGKLIFLKNFFNLLDIFIIFTYFLTFIFLLGDIIVYPGARALNVLRILKLARIIRLFKLTKYTKLLQVLVLTLRASIQAIIVLVLALIIGVIIFATLMYYAEMSQVNSDFTSIPSGFWYVFNVMTTIGDSDTRPLTTFGKLIASTCAVVGIIVIAMPIPVIVANFGRYYQVLIENTDTIHGRFRLQQKEPVILH